MAATCCSLQASLVQLTWIQFRKATGGTLVQFNQYKRDFVIYHPADRNKDHVISKAELETYAEAWRNGENWKEHANQPIPIDSLTLAAQIQWDYEGLYFYFGDHFEGIEEESESYSYYLYGFSSSYSASDFNSVYDVITVGGTDKYYIYKPPSVIVTLNKPSGWTAMAVEEILPEGWSAGRYQETWDGVKPSYVSHVEREDGDLAALTITEQDGQTVVRWGPIKGSPDTLRYALVHPDGLLPTNDQLKGVQSYDGVSRPTTARDIREAYEEHYPKYNDYGVNISDAEVTVPNVDLAADANGDGTPNLVAWLTRGDVMASVAGFEPEFTLVQVGDTMKMRCRFYKAFNTEQAGAYFLKSSNLSDWFYVSPESTIRLPAMDRGTSRAYEALLPCTGNEYFRLLWAEDLPRVSSFSYYVLMSEHKRAPGKRYTPAE